MCVVGAGCTVDFRDPCTATPCLNGGICVAREGNRICECPDGFSGERCEINNDECSPNPCLNGGDCFDFVDAFTCECQSGFTGPVCEINTDDCDLDPCLHGGTCVDGVDEFSCQCTEFWTGPTCSEDACVPRDLYAWSCSSNASLVEATFCSRWTDGNEEFWRELCCAQGNAEETSCIPDGTAGCTAAEGCVRDLWIGVDLSVTHLVSRLRFRSDWWGKAPEDYEVWVSDSATGLPEAGATFVATGQGTPRIWRCVNGESCAPETVPDACCPNGRDQPQDTTDVGTMYSKYDFLDLPPTAGRYWYLLIRASQYQQCVGFSDIAFIGHTCTP